MTETSLYGLVAEFSDPAALLKCASAASAAHYRRMDAYTPYPVEGLAGELGMRFTGVPLVTLLSGLMGGAVAYAMQYYSAVIDYPINVGGRPLHSWPAFVPIVFELTILAAAFGAVLSMLLFNGLPRFHHPIFETPFFLTRSTTHFYLCIESSDPQFDEARTREFLRQQSPEHIWEVRP